MKLMKPEDIPDFIAEIQATGCRPVAVGDRMYIIGDADLPEPQCRDIQPALRAIGEKYGERGHLVEEIAAHLHSLGLSYPLLSTH